MRKGIFRLNFILAALFFPFHFFAQEIRLELLKSISVSAKSFTTDATGNVYLIRGSNELIKYNASGDSVGIFNEVRRGRITQVDATNPLRVILFLAESGQVMLLDNLLSLKNQFRLTDMGIFNAPCLANSADGDIWVYDPTAASLLKVDDQGRILKSASLRQFFDFTPNPISMFEQDRNLFMVDTLQGILRFDQFGFYKTRYPFQVSQVQYFFDQLLYVLNGKLHIYHVLSFRESTIDIPEYQTALQVRVERERLFILRPHQLDIYGILTDPEKK